MLEKKKQRQFWNLHQQSDFRFFFLFFFSVSKNMLFFLPLTCNLKNSVLKMENRVVYFCAEFDVDSKTGFVFFFLALIVFDFCSFEGSKTHFTGETNI